MMSEMEFMSSLIGRSVIHLIVSDSKETIEAI